MNQLIRYFLAQAFFNWKVDEYEMKHGAPPSNKTATMYMEQVLTAFGVRYHHIDNYVIVRGKILLPYY